jgi:NADH:ubiquinone oxidoreductase subunit H
LLVLFGCTPPDRGPNLVDVREVGPRHLEAGERLRVTGAGFPEGRSARITLRGELLRAGEPPVTGVEISGTGELSSPHTLDLALSPELTSGFCGKPDARHTTFRGDVEITFAPRTSSGSPVSGIVEGVVLDVTPDAISTTTRSALRGEGERFAAFVGATLARSEQGLAVTDVANASRAARSGLLAGDVITELHGMILRDIADFVPPPNVRSSALLVQRGAEQVPLRLDSAGFRYHSPQTLRTAVLLIGLALAPLLVLLSPVGRWLVFLERRVSERLRAGRVIRPAVEQRPWRVRSLMAGLGRQLPSSFLAYFAWVAVSALFSLLALGKSIVAPELDLLVVTAGASTSLIFAALASGGGRSRWSLRAGLRRALAALALSIPPLMAVSTASASAGSLHVRELVLEQGSPPWTWLLFASPFTFVAGALALAAMIPTIQPARFLAEEPAGTGARLLAITEWSHKLVCTGTLSIALLGGWQIPGTSSSLSAAALGAVLVLCKSWASMSLVVSARWVVGAVDAIHRLRSLFLWLSLPSVACALLALAWRRAIEAPVLAPVNAELGAIAFGAVLVLALYLARRLSSSARPEGPELGVQSWL